MTMDNPPRNNTFKRAGLHKVLDMVHEVKASTGRLGLTQ